MIRPVGWAPPYTRCPFCDLHLTHVWWQRVIVTAIGLVLAFAASVFFGARGLTLIVAVLVLYFPALVLSMILFFKTIPPRYVKKNRDITILLPRR
jgi:hypothetical protein